MAERFLRYSLENGRRITVILSQGGAFVRKNLTVTSISEDGLSFEALLPGRRRAVTIETDSILTADYARGDHGDLE